MHEVVTCEIWWAKLLYDGLPGPSKLLSATALEGHRTRTRLRLSKYIAPGIGDHKAALDWQVADHTLALLG